MILNDLLKLAKDYRGEGCYAVDPATGDSIVPHNFSERYDVISVLKYRMAYADRTNFHFDGRTISNITGDGLPILYEAHTLVDGGSATWSNYDGDMIGYTKYFLSNMDIVQSGKDFPEIGSMRSRWWFVINKKRVAIHHKVLSDGSFELEILNPTWISGWIAS